MFASNALPPGDIIRSLEELETSIDGLNRQKSQLYKLALILEYDVEAIKQVLHYRRETARAGSPVIGTPSKSFLKYLKAAQSTEDERTEASTNGKPSSGAVPQDQAFHAGTGSETLAGREAAQREGGEAQVFPPSHDLPDIPACLDRRVRAEAAE